MCLREVSPYARPACIVGFSHSAHSPWWRIFPRHVSTRPLASRAICNQGPRGVSVGFWTPSPGVPSTPPSRALQSVSAAQQDSLPPQEPPPPEVPPGGTGMIWGPRPARFLLVDRSPALTVIWHLRTTVPMFCQFQSFNRKRWRLTSVFLS